MQLHLVSSKQSVSMRMFSGFTFVWSRVASVRTHCGRMKRKQLVVKIVPVCAIRTQGPLCCCAESPMR